MPETDKDEPLQQRPGPSDAPTSEYTFVARVPPSVNPERPPVFEEAMDLHSLSWRSVSVTIMDRSSKKPKLIVDNANGIINAGECCALMGPSGSGKTTLLTALAKRLVGSNTVTGAVFINGKPMPGPAFRKISCFVQNDEPFISSLTVSETLHFASRLAGPRRMGKKSRKEQVDGLIESFGLVEQQNTSIGSTSRRSLSNGQKRRVAVARQLVASPKILFLDEPTSGLDAAASFEVVHYLQNLAKSRGLIILCSIHQPAAATLNLFNKLLLISAGMPLYFGDMSKVTDYFRRVGVQIPAGINPTDFLMDMINTDFKRDVRAAETLLKDLHLSWMAATESDSVNNAIRESEHLTEFSQVNAHDQPSISSRILTLMHRDAIKAIRDPMAYGIRIIFNLSFAVLLGTVWLRLDNHQESIQSLMSQIFFALCFISLAAIIYAPAFIEDYLNFVHDRRNRVYGIMEFSASNFVVGLPYLLLSSLLFSAICYWMSNPLREVTAFFNWTLWVFLTSFAAESLIIMVVVIYSNFMFVIAFASFLNSLLLCAEGFFITTSQLNAFYRYGFHYWDYLAYSFQGIMIRQFAGAKYECGNLCECLFNSTLASSCQIAGDAVLQQYGLGVEQQLGKNVAIVISIGLGYRMASMAIMMLRH